MKKLGQKKIGSHGGPGHQHCGECHPVQKNGKAKTRTFFKKEILNSDEIEGCQRGRGLREA